MRLSHLLIGLTLGLTSGSWAAELGLVVGINQYRHAEQAPDLTHLEGAVNDARVLTRALRAKGVELPDARVLIDAEATKANFLAAWRQMTVAAKPGDTLILTLAAHGGKLSGDLPPIDEGGADNDGRDEILMFHDFDPFQRDRLVGALRDDELFELFRDAARFRILMVADTCFSGGLMRSVAFSTGKTRGGRSYDIDASSGQGFDQIAAQAAADNSFDSLPHVVIFTGTNEHQQVKETLIENRKHGALSWFFAQAMRPDSPADANGDRRLSRVELERYLDYQIVAHTDNVQQPQFLPRSGRAELVFELGVSGATPLPTALSIDRAAPLPVWLDGGEPPAEFEDVRWVANRDEADLVFAVERGRVRAYNASGDFVAGFAARHRDDWRRLIAKYRLLNAIDAHYNPRKPPLELELTSSAIGFDAPAHCHTGRHRKGAELRFLADTATRQREPALILFDLAGNGALQMLYPIEWQDSAGRLQADPPGARLPYRLSFEVSDPLGGDDLVALLCQSEKGELVEYLTEHHEGRPPRPEGLARFDLGDCQVGRYAFFTADQAAELPSECR